jgi:predicted RNase H-like HicB family nuclease
MASVVAILRERGIVHVVARQLVSDGGESYLPLMCQEDLMEYRVKLEKTDEGYAVWCPGLPGCWSQGATEEEALENIKDAIETYLATVEELVKDKETRLVEIPV